MALQKFKDYDVHVLAIASEYPQLFVIEQRLFVQTELFLIESE